MTNGFKGLDLIVSEELWTEVPDTVQEAVIKTIPKIKKCKTAKWLSEEDLNIAEKREVKGKGEKGRYTQLCLCEEISETPQRMGFGLESFWVGEHVEVL